MEKRMQSLFYFSVAVLMAIILIWFGSRMLFSPSIITGSGWWLLLGIGLILGGIFMVGANIAAWEIVVGIIAVGFYVCLRAAGIIEFALLAKIIGIACFGEALAGLYYAWPGRRKKSAPDRIDNSGSEV